MLKKKKYIIWFLILVTVGVVIWFLFLGKEEKVEYLTEKAVKGDIIQTVSITGELRPIKEVNISFESSGRITKVFVQEGGGVKEGDLLAQLDTGVVMKAIRQAKADREIQQNNLDLMRRHWDSYKKEEKASAKATVAKAQVAVEAAWENFEKLRLYAPMDGVVSVFDLEVGETVTALREVASIIQNEDLEILARVPEADVDLIKIGQEAQILLDAFSEEEIFKATIIEINPDATIIQDVVYYDIKLSLEMMDDRFKPGLSCDVDIKTNEKKNVLTIPQRAIQNNGGKMIKILVANGEVREFSVETGLKGDEGMVEVLAGVSEGEEVVVGEKGE